MKLTRALWVMVTMIFSFKAFSADLIYTSTFSDVAIKGYDPVAYFIDNKPVKGQKAFETEWKGAKWRFSSKENLELFTASPEKYAPQYGGYCAYAVAKGKLAGIDPNQFSVVEGKLYLNYNAKVQGKWLAERDAFIQDADLNWPTVVED